MGASRQDILEDVQRVAADLSKTPTIREYGEHGEYGRSAMNDWFGTWNECLTAAGLEPNQPRSYDVETHEMLTVYFRDGLTMRETAAELGVTRRVVTKRVAKSRVPAIRSAPVRQILYDSPRPTNICEQMKKETERKYGVVTDGGKCWIELDYIYDEEIRLKLKKVLDYFNQ